MRRTASHLLFVLLLTVFVVAPNYAQVPTGALAGAVTDATGAVVPNAVVTHARPLPRPEFREGESARLFAHRPRFIGRSADAAHSRRQGQSGSGQQ
jgi:hypothetical protein